MAHTSKAPTVPVPASPPWAESCRLGGVSELAVFVPVKRGLIPGECRSYEERLRSAIASLARRHKQGLPVELDRVPTIHFGRMIVLRREQFGTPAPDRSNTQVDRGSDGFVFDEFTEIVGDLQQSEPLPGDPGGDLPTAMLLVLVEFDGELKPYMRDIAQFLGRDFDSIFENCQHFPGTAGFELFWEWIRTFQITTDLFYATYRNTSAVRIHQLERFKRRFDDFVARIRTPTGERRGSMDELFDDFLRAEQQHAAGFPYPGGTYADADPSEGN